MVLAFQCAVLDVGLSLFLSPFFRVVFSFFFFISIFFLFFFLPCSYFVFSFSSPASLLSTGLEASCDS